MEGRIEPLIPPGEPVPGFVLAWWKFGSTGRDSNYLLVVRPIRENIRPLLGPAN